MKTYIRLFFRQLSSHTFFSLIKVSSLAIGFSVSMVLLSLVMNDLGYDQFWEGEDRLYRISMEQYKEGQLSFRSARSYRGLPGMLVEELPEVRDMTRLIPDVITVFVGEQQIQDVKMYYADTNIFKVLPQKILTAESSDVFPSIHSMAISASLARKLYGTVDCIGQKLRLNEGWTFYISTVFDDIPQKSHLTFDVLITRASLAYYMQHFDNQTSQLSENSEFEFVDPGPYHRNSWNNIRSYNYVRIKDGIDMDHLHEKTKQLITNVKLPEQIRGSSIVPDFQLVEDIHLHSDYPDEIKENGSIFRIYMLLLIGVIVLVICWINFINLYVVVFHERLKVFAIRMIHGESFSHIALETVLMGCFISLIAAALSIVAVLVIGLFSSTFHFDFSVLLILLLLVIFTAFLSMLIPLTSFRPGKIMNSLKGKVFGENRGSSCSQVMVLAQFSAGVVLIACTLVIYFQMSFVGNKELEFNYRNVVCSFSPMTMNQRSDRAQKLMMFRNEMNAISGVDGFCVSSSVPGHAIHFPGIRLICMNEMGETEAFVQRINVDHSYFNLYEINILAGRTFNTNEHYDMDEVVLNRQAAEELGFMAPAKALGEVIRMGNNNWKVVGIIENYHHHSLKDKLMPIAFFKSLQWRAAVGYYSFKLNTLDTNTLERVAEIWGRIYLGEQFLFKFVEDAYLKQYEAEQRFGTSFVIAAILAIITSCLGLLGLTRFNILKRTKEIGIRKTFGSSSYLVLRRLQSETLILVLISTLIGIPFSWLIVRRWLEHFAFRIDLKWWMFLLAFLLVLLVAVLTTILQTWRASGKNPVEALRCE